MFWFWGLIVNRLFMVIQIANKSTHAWLDMADTSDTKGEDVTSTSGLFGFIYSAGTGPKPTKPTKPIAGSV